MYLRVLPERANGPIDVERIVVEALESSARTYAMVSQLVMACSDDDPLDEQLIVMLAKAQNANAQMLSTLRHPTSRR